jgi:osmotically-inducible protein OsmY
MGYAIAAALGALLAYFFDPQNGKRRRNVTRDRVVAKTRRSASSATGAVSSQAYGLKQKATHLREEQKDFDDVTLAHKVETEIFRPEYVPKGTINVNVENGVVYLRGEADRPELIDELVERAWQVQGVRDVENLLHLPGTPAPTEE